jgi:hypothetical protein
MLWSILIAFASVVAFGDAPRFTIDRIEVRNAHRIVQGVIIAETLLRVGRDYDEDDVRAAVSRLARLPFLASAGYSLESGSDEAHRVVVITVKEMRSISFVGDGRFIALSETTSLLDVDYDYVDPTTQWKDAAIGLRWLVGGHGYAHAAMTVLRNRQNFAKNYAAWEIGYTHHDLFGTRLFATVNVRTPVDSVGEATFSPAVIVGFPISASQTIAAEIEDTIFVKDSVQRSGVYYRSLHAERRRSLAWTYDTTDGPFVRTRGTFIRIKPHRWMRDDAGVRSVPRSSDFVQTSTHINADAVDVAALHYWALSETHSVFGGIDAGWGDVDSESIQQKPSYQVVKGGYSRRLGRRDARLELEGRLTMNHPDLQNTFRRNDHDKAAEVLVSWAWKSEWGAVRIGAGYARGF